MLHDTKRFKFLVLLFKISFYYSALLEILNWVWPISLRFTLGSAITKCSIIQARLVINSFPLLPHASNIFRALREKKKKLSNFAISEKMFQIKKKIYISLYFHFSYHLLRYKISPYYLHPFSPASKKKWHHRQATIYLHYYYYQRWVYFLALLVNKRDCYNTFFKFRLKW